GGSRGRLTRGEEREERARIDGCRRAVRAGERVLVEELYAASDFEFTQTKGEVSRPLTGAGGTRWAQHTAPVNKGNSGGPLIAENGTVVGINTLKSLEAADVQRGLSTGQLRVEIDQHAPGVVWK